MCTAVKFYFRNALWNPHTMAHRTSESLSPLKADGIVLKKSELPGSMLLENRIQNQCNLGSTVRLYGRLNCAPRSDRGLLPHHLLHLLCFIQPHTYSSSPVKKPVVLELLPRLLALAVQMTTLQNNFSYKTSSNNTPLLLY